MSQLSEDDVSHYLREHPDYLARWFLQSADDETLKVLARKLKQDAVSIQSKHGPAPSTHGPAPSEHGTAPSAHDPAPTAPCLVKLEESSTGSVASLNSLEDKKIQRYTSFSKVGRNSITSMIFRKYLDGDRTRRASVKKDLEDLRRMSEEELFMELIRDIASELDVNVLCHKILQNVSILTNSDRGSLFLVRGSRDNKYLVSKLFDVTESSTLEQSIHTEANEIVVPFGVGIAGNVALTREAINIKDVYADPRFNQEVDKKTGYRTHSILSMPIVNYEGEVIGVAQIINKITGDHEFTKQDEEIFGKYLTFCGIGITNAQLFEMSVQEFKRNQLLLHLARGIFEEQTNLERLVQKIMTDAQELLTCQKCLVYLLEGPYQKDQAMEMLQTESKRPARPKDMQDVNFSRAYELYAGQFLSPPVNELQESSSAQIARCAVIDGQTVNIPDLSKDARFGHHKTCASFVEKSILCMPIHNSDRAIIGVTQLINKVNGLPFDENDEHIIEAFSIFTGLGIHTCQMYEHVLQLMAKQRVALEVLSYHATASREEAQRIMVAHIPTADDYRLYNYDFDDLLMSDDETIKATIRMFIDANLITEFKIPYETVCRWVCTVKKNYRPVTYHNWRHAFNVCQTMFTMLFTGGLRPKFDAVDVFALMAACLCHDLDHRGTNNAFQVKVASPLAMLYSTSVLEHHHFDHCIMILNSEGNNIFQSFTPDQYRRAIQILEHAILSTDLALYFKKRGEFKQLVETGERKFEEEDKKDLLKAMMMTACDVAAITKPWEVQKKVAQLVTAEFFEQGDIEKSKLGEKPIPMMDRERKDELPRMQVDFIDFICTPIYELFAKVSASLSPLNDGCLSNRQHWQALHTLATSGETDKEKQVRGELVQQEKSQDGPGTSPQPDLSQQAHGSSYTSNRQAAASTPNQPSSLKQEAAKCTRPAEVSEKNKRLCGEKALGSHFCCIS
ncbi:LOW QUALITY PROTEIN: cGMP-specific 3',5'-cyclic phosphodiesterase-like [Physella acuta]|uniref:LOW QUALITY PROTEIN: cGMP-specific 3',5'-cyclic phosphodiesterase-like n=1 Tax=Physella acuta TaxID=109671 RepID=UPI0027DCF855|nr:LOW QUALITY PROTEIN: cGMP-specific 3',5'-cyclic phosphodiesterase-like [Physella acuta]